MYCPSVKTRSIHFSGLEDQRASRGAGRDERVSAGHSVLADISSDRVSKSLLSSVFSGQKRSEGRLRRKRVKAKRVEKAGKSLIYWFEERTGR